MKTIRSIQYDDAPIVASSTATIADILELILQEKNQQPDVVASQNKYLLVVHDNELVGILTERDIVQVASSGSDIHQTPVSMAMSRQLITMGPESLGDPISVLSRFRLTKVKHIPIVGEQGHILGVVSHEHIRNSLESPDSLRRKTVEEIMVPRVFTATRSTVLQEVAQTMSRYGTSCIVICDRGPDEIQIPVGIITEHRILELLHQGLDFSQVTSDSVMSSPLHLLSPHETVGSAQQNMKELNVQRLVVAEGGCLRGILTQSSILYSLHPTDEQSPIRFLRNEVERLELEKVLHLQEKARSLESAVASAEKRFQAIFNQTFQMIGLLHPNGTLLEANQIALSFGQLKREDVVGRKFWETPWWSYSREVQQELKDAIAQAATGEFIRYEVEVQDGQGHSITVDFSLRPIQDEQGQVSLIIPEGRDITDRKKAEQKLQHSRDFENLIASISTKFINVQDEDLDQAFQKAVEQLGRFFKAETSFLYQLQPSDTYQMTHEWVQPGLPCGYDPVQSISRNKFPGSLQHLEAQNIIAISSLSAESRTEFKVDVAHFHQWGLEALLVVPIHIKQKLIACLGFAQYSESFDWSEIQTQQLNMIGEVFGNTLERLRVERHLRHHQANLESLVKYRTAALTESEERFRIMADHAPVLIWVSGTDKSCTYFNRPWLDFTGYSLEQELKAGWCQHIHPEDLNRCLNIFNYAFEARTAFSMEYRFKRHDGEYRWMLNQGVPRFQEDQQFCGYVGSCVDVTERIYTEQALLESDERFQLAFAGSEDGLFDWNLTTDQIYFSPKFKAILGYREHQLSDTFQSWKSHLYLADRDQFLRTLQQHLKDQKPFNLEHRMYTRQGKICWVQTRGTAVWNREGEPTRMVGSIRDISHRKQMERELFREKELAQVTLHSIGDAVVSTDADGRIEYFNPIAEKLTGWKNDEVLGQSVSHIFKIIHETTQHSLENPIFEALQTGRIVKLVENAVLVSRDGQKYNIEDSAAPIRNHQGDILGAVMVFRDVTGSRQLARKISWQASHDALTRLCNRREFESQVQRELSGLDADSGHVLCFLDLDRFKIVNDSCGHLAGDQLLRQVSNIILRTIRTSDLLARIGGDEFGLLLKDCEIEDASNIADKIRSVVQDYRFTWKNQIFSIGVSIGLVHLTSSEFSLQEALSAADAACYAAKERGRNRIHIYAVNDQHLTQQRQERQWSLHIRQALEEDRFRLFYQTITPTGQGESETLPHAEILIRMVSPEGELILPGTFLSAAERYDLMPLVDRWVLRHSLEALAHLPESSLLQTHRWMINLSGASVGDDTFLDFVLEELKTAHVPPERIGFEITETAAIANLAQAQHLIQTLQNIGCHFALDDFGSGMSSFGYLKTLPVNYLKIDGQFIRNIHNDAPVKAMVEAINHVGHVMNIQTIAEWVELPVQQDLLKEIGVDYMQGFGIHKPCPLEFTKSR